MGFFLAALAFFVAAFYALRHSNQIALHLAGDLAEESAAYPQERDFWVQLAFVLFAFYLIAHATADAGAAVTALIFDSRAPNPEGRVVGSSVQSERRRRASRSDAMCGRIRHAATPAHAGQCGHEGIGST